MATFVFTLQGVLRQRTHVEQQRQRELALIQRQMTALEAQLARMDATVQATHEDVRKNRLTGTLDLSFLAAHRRFTFAMQRKAITLAQQMAGVQKQLQDARAAWALAAKRRKAIEKLRERQFEQWRQHLARREAAENDEIGMQMSYRAGVE